ncbi:hypothetical protein [Actinacidiphila paucisporea]|uniref:Uncharacterized protein n=1 Tax=Actinacidiphila paucisporea TaxID=310782 RepID=A0A1M7NKE6_9ACTN|nr:hypothetical protein [Actinacidiphila paucisporea]SHN04351.1 hypothetical protein SAMN05216499_11921 [Actinacidiphila paucisporea]
MIGYEIEISLPVTDAAGKKISGDTKLAETTARHPDGPTGKPFFRVVSDTRSLPNRTKYSNLEFVTKPWSVVGDGHTSGPAALLDTLQRIRTVRDAFYHAKEGTLSGSAGGLLQTLPAGKGARFAPNNGYREVAGTAGNGDGLFVHYSVGVPLAGMATFFDRLRPAVPSREGAYLPDARHRLHQAHSFAENAADAFVPRGPAAPAKGADGFLSAKARHRREVLGYLQLLYMQVTAFADHADELESGGADAGIKNRTVVLSRAPLAEVHARLDPVVQTALRNNHDALTTMLADEYHEKGRGQRQRTFYDTAFRKIDGDPVVLLDYTKAAFTGEVSIPQQSVFGGMRQISPHVEEEAVMVPFEIRTFGAVMKSWDEVTADLKDLCEWVQSSYELGMA